MRKITTISLTLIFTLVFGTMSSFAAAWEKDPENVNDPTVTVSYMEIENGYEMKMAVDGISGGYLDLNGTTYNTSEVYKVSKKIDDHNIFVCWLSNGNKLYYGSIIGESTPVEIPAIESDGVESDGIVLPAEKIWTVKYELVPTNKRPAKSQITANKIWKKTKTKVTQKAYYISGKKVSKSKYNAAKKTGKYKVVKTKKTLKKTSRLIKTEKIFTDADIEYIGETPEEGSYYSQPMKAFYNFRLDRYYRVIKNYKVLYKLVRK